ncbi:helix-turn-helix domain-containing protein [Alicyclobacillus macrosporangiidus]|uniref:Transcriptional regulator, contains XRE-family HTH domain n=1 Tax=Alicyclobacillus macrosporangiidus TaxID=392015 RepID=A0A1I7IAV0_9BACL|nr:helix-turn-helix transcriptional regulator [Alicyclobacillus macrosporangiidus]SFU69994.1 Transcriptional regulator, contains XRE-family HTH domain [Alicyclobacillus macrosporangiidus]
MTSFAQRFKLLREGRGWTQDDIAAKLGVSRSTIAGYESENKGRVPREETLIKIAELLGCTTDYLLGRTDDPHASAVSDVVEMMSSEERRLLETIRQLPPDKQQQVTQFADFLKSQGDKEDKHTEESAGLDPDDMNAEITEIAAHMESEYGIDDPGFVEHIHNVIRRTLRKYDEMVAKQKNNG